MNRLLSLISVVALIFLGAFAAGCGDSGSDDSNGSADVSGTSEANGSTEANGPAEENGASEADGPDDETQVRQLARKVARYTTKGNAEGFCSLFVPERIDRLLGEGQCVKVLKRGLKGEVDMSQFQIEKVEVDGDQAKVTFGGKDGAPGLGQSTYVKVDGKWYLDTPESPPAEASGE